MMNKRNVITALAGAVLLSAITFALVLRDISYAPVPSLPEETQQTSPPETTTSVPEEAPQVIEDTKYAYACQIMADSNTKRVGMISNSATLDLSLAEYVPEYDELPDPNAMLERWDEGAAFYEIKLWESAPEQYEGITNSLVYLREAYAETQDSVAVTQSRFDTRVAPSLQLYMGYIIEDLGGKFAVRDNLGNKLFESRELPAFANTRDENGIPLFINSSGEYLYIDRDGFALSSYDDALDSRGLYFDYPTGFGISHSSVEIVSRESQGETRFAYSRGGEEITGYAYERAFGFFEGYAYAKNAGGGYSIIDENGNQTASGNRYYTNTDKRRVRMAYLDPAEPGIYSLGYYYFDDGLVRVRQVDTDFEEGLVTLERELLLYADGSEFELPGGFELVAYSEGILLLRSKSTGLYGMFSNDGEWIAQPVFDYAYPFVCGIAVLGFDGGYAGAIDKDGNVVVDFVYDCLSAVSSGSMLAYRENSGWTLLCMAQE